jgi:hypothetical protein
MTLPVKPADLWPKAQIDSFALQARQRDLYRGCLRRHRSCCNRSRSRPTPAGDAVRRPLGGDRQPLHRHTAASLEPTLLTFGGSGPSSPGAVIELHPVIDEVSYEPERDQALPGAPRPPLGFNMSGCSGGPVLMHNVRKGLHRWFLIGLIIRGSGEFAEGVSQECDTIRVRRILFVTEDGTLNRSSSGWLP